MLPPGGGSSRVRLTTFPFTIGRATDCQLVLRDNRASRLHAKITREGDTYRVVDCESRHGITVNGEKVAEFVLQGGEVIGFGVEEGYRLVFQLEALSGKTELESAAGSGGLKRLRSIVEVARTIGSSLSTDHVLSSLLEAALAITGCERAFLLLREAGADGRVGLRVRVGREASGRTLPEAELDVPVETLERALRDRSELLSLTLEGFGHILCVPLIRVQVAGGEETSVLGSVKDSTGLLYLDARQQRADLTGASSELLQALALEASIILENARLLDEERQKLKLERELDIARQIQQDLLPENLPNIGWLQVAGHTDPSLQVGGDFYDVIQTSPNSYAFVVADVAGKGVSSALLASLLQGVFLAAVSEDTPAPVVLTRVNRYLLERTEGAKYATLVLGTIDSGGVLTFVNAGHCRPFLLRASGEIDELETSGMPVGMLDEAAWSIGHRQLQPGDVLVVYSDGCVDARNREGKLFGVRRLRSVLEEAPTDLPSAVVDSLRVAIAGFVDGTAQADDETVLVVRYAGN